MKTAVTAGSGISVIVVGSAALDTIETPYARRENVLGGSVSYACAAASFFTGVGMVAVVGDDFDTKFSGVYAGFHIDTEGLQRVPGRTFRWSGVYEPDMNNRRTLATELNVFKDFQPSLPASYRDAPFVFLANISPELQLHVLSQVARPRFTVVDTMDYWIKTAPEALKRVISRSDMVMLNDSEVRLLAGEHNLVKAAARVLALGPGHVVIKKGEHGALLFSREGIHIIPAYPIEDVLDPTGAGDTFAGGLIGSVAGMGDVGTDSIRKAMLYGSVLASLGVEDFGLGRLMTLRLEEIDRRLASLKAMIAVPS